MRGCATACACPAGVVVDRPSDRSVELGRLGVPREGMRLDELAGLLVEPGDVVLELARLDPPLPAAADLDRLDVAAAHQRVDLGRGDVENLGDVGQLQE